MPDKNNRQFPKLKRFVDEESDASSDHQVLEQSFHSLASQFSSRTTEGTFYVELQDAETVIHTIVLKDGEVVVERQRPDKADLTLRTSKSTWMQMLAGKLSPVDAFLQGNMEILGDLSFGKRLYAMAAQDDVRDLNI